MPPYKLMVFLPPVAGHDNKYLDDYNHGDQSMLDDISLFGIHHEIGETCNNRKQLIWFMTNFDR